MDLTKAIAAMKEKILKDAERDAKRGHAEGVAAAGKKLERILQLESRNRALLSDLEAFERGDEVTAEQIGGDERVSIAPSGTSDARERGRKARQELVASLK